MTITLPETASQLNTPDTARLLALLSNLPAEERADVYLGIMLNLVVRFDAEKKD